MTIELIPLAKAVLNVTQPIDIGVTFGGRRLVGEITDSVWTGDRLKARMTGSAAADWARVSDQGVGEMDVRTTLKTEDGALIYVHYQGRLILSGPAPVLFTAPLFETSDPRYTWLNSVQAVAKGTVGTDGLLTYDVFEVR